MMRSRDAYIGILFRLAALINPFGGDRATPCVPPPVRRSPHVGSPRSQSAAARLRIRQGQARMVQRIAAVAADALAVHRSGVEHQYRRVGCVLREYSEHSPLVVM